MSLGLPRAKTLKLVVHDAGQRVQIYFSDAAGLVAGRTTIRYQGLEVGMVRDITLSKDLSSIYVDADIYPEAKKLLSKGTRFWLVKPTASLSGVRSVSDSYNKIAVSVDVRNLPKEQQQFNEIIEYLPGPVKQLV